jgi:ATP-dependent protease ClpP protease subunit
MLLSGFSAIAMSLTAASCSEARPSAALEYHFSGLIDENASAQFKAILASHPEDSITITIDSPGGAAPDAMNIGDAILSHGNVHLVVNKFCHSACVQYIMPSAKTVDVMPLASVAFHGSPSTLQLPSTAPLSVVREISSVSEREERFYTARHINVKALRSLQRARRTFCRFEVAEKSRSDLNRYATASYFAASVPSKDLLFEMGYKNVSGFWPEDLNEAKEAARHAGFNEKLSIVYVTAADVGHVQPPRQLPECPKPIKRPT